MLSVSSAQKLATELTRRRTSHTGRDAPPSFPFRRRKTAVEVSLPGTSPSSPSAGDPIRTFAAPDRQRQDLDWCSRSTDLATECCSAKTVVPKHCTISPLCTNYESAIRGALARVLGGAHAGGSDSRQDRASGAQDRPDGRIDAKKGEGVRIAHQTRNPRRRPCVRSS